MLKDRLRRLGQRRRARGSGHHVEPSTGPRLKPIFVGGTGRSGTHVVAWLLGAHPECYRFPAELRFIADRGGLCDLVEGRSDLRRFEKKILGRWLGGLHGGPDESVDRATVEALLKKHRAGFKSDPWTAAAAFTHDLLDPIAAAHGATAWVEKTPATVLAAPTMLKLFPEMRLIHSLRDGRDVACSVTSMRWGPTDVDEALDWWAEKVEEGYAACASLPEDRLLVSQMERLIEHDRDRELTRLLDFLGLDDDPDMRAYFASDLTPARAHIGRWRHDVPAERLAAFDAHYQRLASGLIARGRDYMADASAATVATV